MAPVLLQFSKLARRPFSCCLLQTVGNCKDIHMRLIKIRYLLSQEMGGHKHRANRIPDKEDPRPFSRPEKDLNISM
jgi:hypothetical protein